MKRLFKDDKLTDEVIELSNQFINLIKDFIKEKLNEYNRSDLENSCIKDINYISATESLKRNIKE